MTCKNSSFEEWMAAVDNLFAKKFYGLTSDDFEDYLWYDAYDNGATPEEAVDEWEDITSEYY